MECTGFDEVEGSGDQHQINGGNVLTENKFKAK